MNPSILEQGGALSAVIACRDDAARVTRAVREASRVADEVIVVDGGSSDDTVALARRAGARVINAPPLRAGQFNAGAEAAVGDVLLLLDVDAALAPEAAAGVRSALADESVRAGSFRVRYEPDSRRGRLAAWLMHGANAVGAVSTPTGLFVRRRAYLAAGGLRESALLPRLDLLRRVRGRTVYLAEHAMRVSARRLPRTPVRALALWALLRALYALGVTSWAAAR
ncbi:MAG: glycosyltransferase [Polyangiales bacterium]